ncbi:hypothetical protein IHE51_00410 [Candidatus Parvarchaeota archaeon]|uniref:Uncharacterized protein n=1 Tax=Candidatus Acidifodinimicrobium mancum TaxID=2898728 RepID=A0A8T3UVB9_9ARCH|nr:hypothetical protein [Candidatus Acidifodinimicrobium mancum]
MEPQKGTERKKDLVLLLLLIAVVGVFVFSYASHYGPARNANSPVSTYASSTQQISTFQQASNPSPQQTIVNNEEVSTNPNVLTVAYVVTYDEEFIPGNPSPSGCTYYSTMQVTAKCNTFGRYRSCVALTGFPNSVQTSSVSGFFGYPQSSGLIPRSHNELFSGVLHSGSFGSNTYYITYPSDQTDNFAGWSSGGTAYSFDPTYHFAINYSFPFFVTTGNTAQLDTAQSATSTGDATFVVPAVSCGSTFLTPEANVGSYTIGAVTTLSGFTPSVGEASNVPGGVQALYLFFPLDMGGLDNPFYAQEFYQSVGMLSSSALHFFDSSFNFTEPGLNYANFPAGNKGDELYYNVSNFFNTTINYTGGIGRIAYAYESKDVILTYQTTTGTPANITYALTKSNVSAYTVPNLEASYFPELKPQIFFFTLVPEIFKIDGVFPICNYPAGSYAGPSCTFENGSSVNQISPYRIWDYKVTYSPSTCTTKGGCTPPSYYNTVISNPPLSGYASTPETYRNDIEYNPYTPGYTQNLFVNTQNPLNLFESRVMDSFCFYNDSLNVGTGQYESPGYTRIIPPTSLENYTVAIGECNALFNNTNCFTTVLPNTNGQIDTSLQSGNYMNFKYGIFVGDPTCTKYGIVPYNVTDAWINGVAIANNGGQYCGLFGGQKNLTNPLANSTLFTIKSYNCPSFNSNSSVVPLIITVKNVGNGNITNPYLVVLYNNTNISKMFYSSPQSASNQYDLYQNFLNELSSSSFSSVFQIRYINGLETEMYVSTPSNPLQDIPIAQIFQSASSNSENTYINGPYNNSLLGIWIYHNGQAIRSANTFLGFANSSDTKVPTIVPGGTASFTVNVPMPVFRKLMEGGENISVFFGNTFNVSFYGSSNPATFYHTYGPAYVPSSTENSSLIHNQEYIDPSSAEPSPIWQYIVSYKFNLTSMPFANVSIYNDSLNFTVSALKNTTQKLNVSVGLTVSKLNGTGYYPSISASSIRGSTLTCFASQDNLNDFSVYWFVQPSSPSNINYLLKAVYGQTSPYQNEVIDRWRGILFMPFSSPVVLNYNNVPYYPGSTVSFETQRASVQTTQTSSYKEAILYFGNGQESSLYSNLNDSYYFFNTTANTGIKFSNMFSPPTDAYGFKMVADAGSNDPSIIRIASMKVLTNPNPFSNIAVTISPGVGCAFTPQNLITNSSGVVSVSSSYINNNCRSVQGQNYTISIRSKGGPFTVSMYNSSYINMSNISQNHAYVIAANFSRGNNDTGYYNTTLIMPNSSVSLANGASFVFSYTPLSTINKNVDAYLYYINGSPFSCNFVNKGIGVNDSSVSQIGLGEYSLGSGQIFCNAPNQFSYIRAVMFNASNNEYLGSSDIGSGLTVNYLNATRLYITYNGQPINSQNATLINIVYNNGSPKPETCFEGKIVVGGILNASSNYPCSNYFTGGSPGSGFNYDLIVYLSNGGSVSPVSVYLSNITASELTMGNMIARSLDVIADDPSSLQNMSFSSTIPTGLPIQFSLPLQLLGSSCNLLRITEYGNYPYEELPYQVVQSQSNICTYMFMPVIGKQNYTLLEGTGEPSVNYPSNWLNYSSYNGYYGIKTSNGAFNLFPECRPGYGPCLSNTTIYGQSVGNTLINNVSVEPSSVSVSLVEQGPIMDCFDVSFTSSQTINNGVTGFGQINYNLNSLYLITNPTENFISSYCFFNGGNIVLDSIYGQGNPVNFFVENSLNGNFSLAETNNALTLNVSKPIQTSCSQYSTVTYTKAVATYQSIQINPAAYFNSHCLVLQAQARELQDYSNTININPITLNPNENGFYCLYTGTPATYSNNVGTSAPSFTDNTNVTTGLGFLYNPGNYNITFTEPSGQKYTTTYYGLCKLPAQSGGSYTYTTLSEPQFYLNGAQQPYDGSLAENKEINSSAAYPYSSALYNPNGGVMINSCPVNTTISSYTPCISSLSFTPVNNNLNYGGLECIPTAATTGSNYPIGGGCLIDSTYSCAPTAGTIYNSYPGNFSFGGFVSSTGNLPFSYSSGSRIPTSAPSQVSASFSCVGSANVTEVLTIENASNTTKVLGSCSAWLPESVSCSYSDGSVSGTTCSPAFITPGTMNENPLTFTSECSMITNPSDYYTFPYSSGNCPTSFNGSGVVLVPSAVTGVAPADMYISSTPISFTQSEPTAFNPTTFLCGNETNNIATNVQSGWTWHSFTLQNNNIPTTGNAATLPDIGGCEACRYTYALSNPTITNQSVPEGGIQYTYSCPSGSSGSILSCQSYGAPSRSTNQSLNYTPSLCTGSTFKESYKSETFTSNSPQYGATCLSCAALPQGVNASAYQAPSPQYNCFAYANPKNSTSESSFALQYSYTSNIGVGLGIINSTSPLNVYIPGNNNAKTKDFYMTSLSVSQHELINEFTQLYPFKPLESAIESVAMFESPLYPYDLLSTLMLQYPYFAISGVPGFVNGSELDYAMNIFSGGTQGNCPGSLTQGNNGIFSLGEGALCDGGALPSTYSNGIYLLLGGLNEGVHSVQFYSVKNSSVNSPPSVSLYSSSGVATNLNTKCSNGNSRVFSTLYKGAGTQLNITSDEDCNNINSALYGYIVNCIYQGNNNQTYAVYSNYYMAYNLPTVWNISYTLLVSPKSYNVIPVPIYEINTSTGPHLSIYPPK